MQPRPSVRARLLTTSTDGSQGSMKAFACQRAAYQRWRASLTAEEEERYWPTTTPRPIRVIQTFECQRPEDWRRYESIAVKRLDAPGCAGEV